MSHRDDYIYCTIHRNGSGQDSGRLDYAIRYSRVEKLSTHDAEELVRVARDLLIELGELIDACTCAVCHAPVEIPADAPLPNTLVDGGEATA